MSTPANKRPLAPKGSNLQIVFGAILAISLLLAINFSGRIAAGHRIAADRDKLQVSISTLQAQATALQSELSFVNSDDFINQWARKDGHMIKGSEILVIPVAGVQTPQPTPTPFTPTTSGQDTQKNDQQSWKLWWQLFFDSPPPDNNGS